MTNITLTRYDVENLFIGLERLAACSVPQSIRYAIARTTAALRPEVDATNTAYPRPENATPEAIATWNQGRHAHMMERVEVSVHPPKELPEIEFADLERLLPDRPMPVVHQFHQALISSLLPWVDACTEPTQAPLEIVPSNGVREPYNAPIHPAHTALVR